MCKINEVDLMESGHGFSIFDEKEVDERYQDEVDYNPLWGPMSYSQKSKTQKALEFVKVVYLVEGSEAARKINENDWDPNFWDRIEAFHQEWDGPDYMAFI